MEISVIALVGISLGAMFFGYFFGLFEGRGQGYRRRKMEEPLEGQAQSLGENLVAAPAADPGFAGTQPSAWLELAGDDQGQPRLDLDGHRVDTTRPDDRRAQAADRVDNLDAAMGRGSSTSGRNSRSLRGRRLGQRPISPSPKPTEQNGSRHSACSGSDYRGEPIASAWRDQRPHEFSWPNLMPFSRCVWPARRSPQQAYGWPSPSTAA